MKTANCNDIHAKSLKKIFDKIYSNYGRRKMNKLFGDICVRLFAQFIKDKIPQKFRIAPINAYIENFPNEFDILIVKKDAVPISIPVGENVNIETNVYKPEDVRLGIEVKALGVFGNLKRFREGVTHLKENFENIKKSNNHIDFIYFTFRETTKVKRKGSIIYFNETIKCLAPYNAFCLSNSRTGEETEDKWIGLLEFLNNL
jgi:hypothetical protein